MASQAKKGLKVDKGFRPQAIHAAVLAMKDEFGVIFTVANVSNHLRTLRKRWARIRKLKELSGMGWDNTLSMIIMGEEEYKNYVKIHPQDESYLNKSIEDHDMLETICDKDHATGRGAIQFGDPIGTRMDDNVESQPLPRSYVLDDNMSFEETNYHVNTSPPIHNQTESSEPTSGTSSHTKKGKRKRKSTAESEAIHEMNNTIKEAFASMKTGRLLAFAKDLSTECMKLKAYGYSGHEISKVYDWLMADEIRVISFFGKDEELKKCWAENFFESLRNEEGSRGSY